MVLMADFLTYRWSAFGLMWLFHTFVQFVIALAGVATITTPIAMAAATSTTSFRLRTNRISVLPRSTYLAPDGGGAVDLPWRYVSSRGSVVSTRQGPEDPCRINCCC